MSATAAPPTVSVRASRTDDFPVPTALAMRPVPTWPATALAVSLLAALAYAAFDHGAAGQVAQARLSTALALVAVAAGVLWLWHGGLRTEAPRAAWLGIAMFAGFAVWTGLTLSWSISPSGTWTELNRVIAYALVTVLALAAAAWDRRVLGRVAVGYLVIVTVVALYALGGKALPGVSIGPIDLDQTSFFSRLRAPLDYWNGLAIFVVLAVPIALRLAADRDRAVSARIASLISLALLLITVALTYSRGGVLALVVAVGVSVGFGGARLRSLGLLGLAALSAGPALAYSLTSNDLTGLLVPLKDRESSGFVFLLLLVAGLIVLGIGARVAISADERNAITPARAHAIARLLFAAVAVAIVVGLGALAVSDRGLTGSISHQAHEFTKAKGENISDPNRLLSTSSGNRWVWWREAAGAWSDRPLEGWGAGSFPLLHRQYRRNRLEVLQPPQRPDAAAERDRPGRCRARARRRARAARRGRRGRATPRARTGARHRRGARRRSCGLAGARARRLGLGSARDLAPLLSCSSACSPDGPRTAHVRPRSRRPRARAGACSHSPA